jgi:hypothetical protein
LDFRFLQPAREENKTSDDVNDAGWNPHDQAAKLLIFKRRESPRLRGVAIGRIPYSRTDRQQNAKQAVCSAAPNM